MLRLLLLIPLIGGAYFVIKRAFPYLVVTAESYGEYFWPRVEFVLPHVVFGIVAITLGALQFVSRIRTRHMAVHRFCGWTYVISVLLGAIAGFTLAATSQVTMVYAVGLGTVAIVWVAATLMGVTAMLRGNIRQHKHWMVRSYVLTFAFPAFRLVEEGLGALEIGTRYDQLSLAAWTCWTIPLFVTEVVLQWRDTCKTRAQLDGRRVDATSAVGSA